MTAKKQNRIEITLREFIAEQVDKMGIDAFKHQFGVTESCVNHWRRGANLPKAHHLMKLEKLSKGRLNIAHVVEKIALNQARKKKPAALRAARK